MESIYCQTIEADEVIISDDNSKDSTVKIIQEFIETHNLSGKWTLLQNDVNFGYPGNFYRCLKRCKGDFVFFSDQDDRWNLDKIEKMSSVICNNEEVYVLCSKHGIIDENGNILQDITARKIEKSTQTCSIKKVSIDSILRSYHYPGMCMCVRSDWIKSIFDRIVLLDTPHDYTLAILSSDMNKFWHFDYLGAYHRRHSNNTAKEEHRILKRLEIEKKIMDIKFYNKMINRIIAGNLELSNETVYKLNQKLTSSMLRMEMLSERSLKKFCKLYRKKLKIYGLRPMLSDFVMLLNKQ